MSMEFLMGVPGKLKKLLDRLTSTRAGYLDNLPRLDTSVSSRAPSSTALSNTTWTSARAAKIDNLDAAVSSRLSSVVKQVLHYGVDITIPANSALKVTVPHTIPAVNVGKSIVFLRQSGNGSTTGVSGIYNEATISVSLGDGFVNVAVDPSAFYSAIRVYRVRFTVVEFN